MRVRTCLFLLVSLLSSSVSLAAPILRTFVSAVAGSDSNPCTRLAPCRNFAAAMANTLPGGEIVVLESGGYGPTVVDKSLAIIAPAGVYAAIAPSSGTAIVVASGDSSRVRLQGLNLISMGAGVGISVTNAIAVDIDSCVLRGFPSNGISVDSLPTGVGVAVRNTTVIGDRTIGSIGILAVWCEMVIENSHISRHEYGVSVVNSATVAIRNSSLSYNSGAGVLALAAVSSPNVHVDSCHISHGTNGVLGGDFLQQDPQANANVVITNSVFSFLSGTGLSMQDGATGNVSGSKFFGMGLYYNTACVWHTAAGGSIRSGGDNIVEPPGNCDTASSVYGRK